MIEQAQGIKSQAVVSDALPGGPVLARMGELEVRLATTPEQIRSALRLRYRVFCQEMGARQAPVNHRYEIETDRFDTLCDHIIVCDTTLSCIDGGPLVVGTYRALPAKNAAQGFYSQSEFDLTDLLARQAHLSFCEVGRSCVAASHRTMRTIEALWCGLWAYACRNGIDVYFGAASFPGTDPQSHAPALAYLYRAIGAPEGWQVHAHRDKRTDMDMLKGQTIDRHTAVRAMPPLIRGYMRVNAYVGLSACIDREFGTTDVMIITPLSRLPRTYRRHFIAATGLDRPVEAERSAKRG